jgi:hypothetical protein
MEVTIGGHCNGNPMANDSSCKKLITIFFIEPEGELLPALFTVTLINTVRRINNKTTKPANCIDGIGFIAQNLHSLTPVRT